MVSKITIISPLILLIRLSPGSRIRKQLCFPHFKHLALSLIKVQSIFEIKKRCHGCHSSGATGTAGRRALAASVVSIRVKALDSLVVVTSEMLSATDVELRLSTKKKISIPFYF